MANKISKIEIGGVEYELGGGDSYPITVSGANPTDAEGNNGDLWFTSGNFNLFTPVTVASNAATITEPGLYLCLMGTYYSTSLIYINSLTTAAYGCSARYTSTEFYPSYSTSTKKITSSNSSYPVVKCWKIAGV